VTVLAPLAARYGIDRSGVPRVEIPPEPDGVVRAMPVVLRLERPPAIRTPSLSSVGASRRRCDTGSLASSLRTSVLEAAARAALALCLDPRAEPGGEWHEDVATWVDARIRKIARRARGAHWAAVQELPGVTVAVGAAQARALLPGPVDDVPKVVSRLQIGGTDLPDDQPGAPPPGVPVIWVNGALSMTVGKAAAQVGHASMLDAAARGLTAVPPYAVRTAAPAAWARLCDAADRGEAVAVRDAGFTEVAPGTITTITTPG
jgi:peptidyl-tRNA hydrolase